MTALPPIAVRDATAAAMLELPLPRFRELAEAGCSDAEIQAVTGQSTAMVAFYRKKASRKRLSRAAQERRE